MALPCVECKDQCKVSLNFVTSEALFFSILSLNADVLTYVSVDLHADCTREYNGDYGSKSTIHVSMLRVMLSVGTC